MKVKDLVQRVADKLANRQDVNAKAIIWIKDAVLELTENYAFTELQTTGPTVNFIINQSEYLPSYFTNNNEKATMIDSWWVTISGVSGWNLKFRSISTVEGMSKLPGPPSKWSQYGKKFILGPNPDQAYSTFMRYQKLHPFSDNVQEDEILMPDSWKEIIEYAAAERGAIEIRALDYATLYHKIIYGDPFYEKSGGTKGTPGLIFKRQSQFERNASNNERQLQPIVVCYTG